MKAAAAVAVDQRSEIGRLRRELEAVHKALEKIWRSATLLGEQLPVDAQPQWNWSSIKEAMRGARDVLDRSPRAIEGPLTRQTVTDWLDEAAERNGADACRIVALATAWLNREDRSA